MTLVISNAPLDHHDLFPAGSLVRHLPGIVIAVVAQFRPLGLFHMAKWETQSPLARTSPLWSEPMACIGLTLKVLFLRE
jgi:hypothetical protein